MEVGHFATDKVIYVLVYSFIHSVMDISHKYRILFWKSYHELIETPKRFSTTFTVTLTVIVITMFPGILRNSLFGVLMQLLKKNCDK